MPRDNDLRRVCAFHTKLGWMAICGHGDTLQRLTFGHGSAGEALAALPAEALAGARIGSWYAPLVARLKSFAAGEPEDFLDIAIDLQGYTPFQLRVVQACRRIPVGETKSYADLAKKVGAPGAARAVGNVMRTNRLPLVVPCHRVVGASGLGGYSAPEGLTMKRRLLALEKAGIAARPRRTSRRREVLSV